MDEGMGDLQPMSRMVLLVLDDAAAAGEDAVDTEVASQRVVDMSRGTKFHWYGSFQRPWFGLGEAAYDLEGRGFIEIDGDVAPYVGDAPSPTTESFALVIAPRGREVASRLRADAT